VGERVRCFRLDTIEPNGSIREARRFEKEGSAGYLKVEAEIHQIEKQKRAAGR